MVGCVAAHATDHPLWSVGALAVTTAVIATVTTLPATLATAAVCWALHAGFILGRHGVLQLSPESAGAAGVLAAVAVVVNLAAHAYRRHRDPGVRRVIAVQPEYGSAHRGHA